MRIGIDINRERRYGRSFCEGVASWVDVRPDWQLQIVDGRMQNLDGLIAHVMDETAQERLASLGIPVIADFYLTGQEGFAQVLPDHAAIGRLAFEHFQERGFTDYAFCGYDGILFSDARRDGLRTAMAKNGYHALHEYKAPPEAYAGFGNRVILREKLAASAVDADALKVWLKSLPTPCAVFCAHDLRAMQVVSLGKEVGMKVPDDLAVLGVDNDALICSFTLPRLSSIDNNAFGCGRAAAQCLDDIFAGRADGTTVRRIQPCGVIARQSTEIFRYPSQAVNEAMLFIRRNIGRALTASEVFNHIGRTHTYLDELFLAEVGRTVHAEISRLRIAEAKRLLATSSLPFAEIAKRSGFSSVKYFTKVFTAATGDSPSDWRYK